MKRAYRFTRSRRRSPCRIARCSSGWRAEGEAGLDGDPIEVFNQGRLQRDFTYIDDIVDGVMRIARAGSDPERPHRIYNIGNNRPEPLLDFIATLEGVLGVKAEKILKDMQPGDVHTTAPDISAIQADYGCQPSTTIAEGLPHFTRWLKAWRAGRAESWSQA